MNQEVTKEKDGISKTEDRTEYFLLPRHDLAVLSTQPQGDGFILRFNGYTKFINSNDEPEIIAEGLITIARETYVGIKRCILPGNTDACTQEALEADYSWIKQAGARIEARRNQNLPRTSVWISNG